MDVNRHSKCSSSTYGDLNACLIAGIAFVSIHRSLVPGVGTKRPFGIDIVIRCGVVIESERVGFQKTALRVIARAVANLVPRLGAIVREQGFGQLGAEQAGQADVIPKRAWVVIRFSSAVEDQREQHDALVVVVRTQIRMAGTDARRIEPGIQKIFIAAVERDPGTVHARHGITIVQHLPQQFSADRFRG